MAAKKKARGGVIASKEQHTHGVMELLTFHLRDRLDLVYYPHAFDIDIANNHDFIVVLSLNDLAEVVKFYDTKKRPIPLMVHINEPDVLFNTKHELLFPGVEVLAVPQADLSNTPDVTLELSQFSRIVERMEQQGDEPSSPPTIQRPGP